MNKRKYYGRKIKKTKNLYRRKKSAGQKIFGTVVLVVAAAAIAFLGFCIGKPLLDYIGSIGTKEIPEWTPADSYAQQNGSPSESAAAGTTAPAETDEFHTTSGTAGSDPAEPVMSEAAVLVASEVPSNALSNRSSLAAVLTKVKAAGCNAAVVQLKDRSGHLHYKSGIEGTEDLTTGSMTLGEIFSAFEENGIIPIAEIAVLSDQAGCEAFTDMNYKIIGTDTSWLDYSTGVPLRWADPASDAVRGYNAGIASEIEAAGFENIMLTDIVFPDLQPYDREFISARYFEADRYSMLYNVVRAGSIIEMQAADVLAEPFGRTAEMLNDTSRLRGNTVALVISRKDLTAENGYPAEAASFTETVLSLAAKKTGNLPVIPVIDSSGFDDAELSKTEAAIAGLGYDSYIIR